MSIALGLTLTIAVGITVAVVWAGLRFLHFQHFAPERNLSTTTAFNLLKIAFAVVAGVGGVVALVTAYRRQRVAEQAEIRERARLFNERFATAAGQLGHDSDGVRLAGVYAMAGLGDDWPERRQTCVDVLCAYLRVPYVPPGQGASAAELAAWKSGRDICHTVIRVIASHFQPDSGRPAGMTSWRGLDLDFTGVVFDGGDFSRAEFTGGRVLFDGARFVGGAVNFTNAQFSGGTVNFTNIDFSGGTVNFSGAGFSGGTVNFMNSVFSDGAVNFDGAGFRGAAVNFSRSRLAGGTLNFDGAEFSRGSVSFRGAHFAAGTAHFRGALITGGAVYFMGAKFSGGTVYFGGLLLTAGRIAFGGAQFVGSTVDFSGARFLRGLVYFGRARFASGIVEFNGAELGGSVISFAGQSEPWTDNPAQFSGGTVDFSQVAGRWHEPQFPAWENQPSGLKLPPHSTRE